MATLFDNLTDNIANVRANRSDTSAMSGRANRILELRLPSGWPDSGELEWCLRDGDSISAHGCVRTLDDLPGEVRNAPIHVWSPAEATLLTSVQLPTKSRSKIVKALPYALEDRLLTDPSELFFTFDRDKGGELNVSVTSRAILDSWISQFDEPGLQLRSMTPESLSIPLLANSWVLFCDGQDCWLRTGKQSGLKCRIESDNPPYVLTAALRQASQKPDTLVIHNPPEALDQGSWGEALGLAILTEQSSFWDVAERDHEGMNLLRDEFAPRTKTLTFKSRFRPAAYLLGIWLTGTVAVTSFEWWQLEREHNSLTAEMTAIFKASFPQQASVVVDPYRQMQANLSRGTDAGRGQSESGFLVSIGAIAPIISTVSNSSVTDIEYRNNSLIVGMKLPDYRTVENVKSALDKNQIDFTVLRTRQSGKVVLLQLRIDNKG